MILLDQVGLSYGDDAPTLNGVSLRLAPGSFHFLTGPSGAGKTSLMKLLYLALRPTTGRMTAFERNVALLSRAETARMRRRIGVVFQDFRLLDHLTAAENVALPLRVAGGDPARYRSDVSELLAWVGLGDKLTARPPALSGGEKQRVALARALIASPDLILADEPTGNVDPEMGLRIMSLFGELNRLGKTVLLATHDLGMVAQLAPRFDAQVLRVENGRLRRTGSAA